MAVETVNLGRRGFVIFLVVIRQPVLFFLLVGQSLGIEQRLVPGVVVKRRVEHRQRLVGTSPAGQLQRLVFAALGQGPGQLAVARIVPQHGAEQVDRGPVLAFGIERSGLLGQVERFAGIAGQSAVGVFAEDLAAAQLPGGVDRIAQRQVVVGVDSQQLVGLGESVGRGPGLEALLDVGNGDVGIAAT